MEQSIKLLRTIKRGLHVIVAGASEHNTIESVLKNSFTTISVETETKKYGIDTIRELKTILSHRAQSADLSVYCLKNANTMTIEAQNALLKILEELPANTAVCLVASSETSLLPTIRSRAYVTRVTPATLSKSIPELAEKILSTPLNEGRMRYLEELFETDLLEDLILAARNMEVDSAQRLSALNTAKERLDRGGSSKIVLTDLMIQL